MTKKPKHTAPKGGGSVVEINGHAIDLLLVNYVGPVRFNSDGFYFRISFGGTETVIDGENFRAAKARTWLLEKLGWTDIEVYEPEKI